MARIPGSEVGADVRALAELRSPPAFALPTIALVGSSGSGKTTLIEQLLPRLAGTGVRVAVVKHTHCDVDLDQPGKDSHRVAEAGAAQVIVASRDQWAIIGRVRSPRDEPSLASLVSRLDPSEIDLVLAEGFHFERVHKIEVYRPSHGKPMRCASDDPDLVAIATDAPMMGSRTPVLDLNDIEVLVQFIRTQVSPAVTRSRAI
jgi:molybdopterin-guanine dinucleotide biosynthesis adapter protein